MNSEMYFSLRNQLTYNKNNFKVLMVDTFDEHLTTMVVESLDYILRFKRDFMRGLSVSQINKLCNVILKMLQD